MLIDRQILDKTIEYLNKYSVCFKKWRIHYYPNKLIRIDAEIFQLVDGHVWRHPISIEYSDIDFISSNGIEEFEFWRELFHQEVVFASEFRIAYNIIKDLAQHGTSN